jgi:hypothetical protein
MAEAGVSAGNVRAEDLTIKNGKILCPCCLSHNQTSFLRRFQLVERGKIHAKCINCQYIQYFLTTQQINLLYNLPSV